MKAKASYCARITFPRALLSIRRELHMGRIVPEVESDLDQKLRNQDVTAKRLLTRRNYGFVGLPAQLHAIAESRLRQYSDKEFRAEARYLIDVMQKMKQPDDEHTLKMKRADIKTELELRGKITSGYDPSAFEFVEDDMLQRDRLAQMIEGIVDDRRRDWHYYEYDARAANMYMATRLAPNYACISTVLREIHDLNPNFKPESVLDYGSGMGTTIWAVENVWPGSVTDFMNVDISTEQQNLCEYLLRGGRHIGHNPLNVYHRQYLPASDRDKYDIVMVAFSLLELPNRELRAQAIESLWQKTNDLLVVIERGNRGGFTIVNEARHFVLDYSGHDVTKKITLTSQTKPVFKRRILESHCLAPCPHEFACPRSSMPTKKDLDICNFRVFYEPLEFGKRKPATMLEDFSYVVIRKKPHPSQNDELGPKRWPRVVEKVQKRGGHIRHTLCCPNGNLAETVITAKKYGKSAQEISKASKWGDILPIKVHDVYESRNRKLIKKN